MNSFLIIAILTGANALQLPSPPNNIECFFDTDYCALNNFLDYTGKSLRIEIVRNNIVVGAAEGVVSGNALAFEVNHPGGLCWGDNTNLKVTPDIKPNDQVLVKFNNLVIAESVVLDGKITERVLVDRTLTIKGVLGPNVNRNNIEIEIVNRDLRATDITKQAINARPGPLVASTGYQSGIIFTNNEFVATFVFNTATTANIAYSGGGETLAMWVETINGNQQGFTLHEFGEAGGPWSASCPRYAEFADIPVSDKVVVYNKAVKWTEPYILPEAKPLTAISLNVLKGETSTGVRINPNTNTFTLLNLDIGDTIELRSMIGTKMSDSISLVYTDDVSQPTINIIQTDTILKMESNTGQIVYTTDGTEPIENGIFSKTCKIYVNEIVITSDVNLKAISFTKYGKQSETLSKQFTIVKTLPAVPVLTSVEAVNGEILVKWEKIQDASISSYGVQVYNTNNQKIGNIIETTLAIMSIKDLTVGTSYKFTVSAKNNHGWGKESLFSSTIVFPSKTDLVAVVSARLRPTEFRIVGTSTLSTARVTVHRVNADNSIGTPLFVARTTTPISAVVNPVALNGLYNFDIRVRGNSVPANPGRIYLKSSGGGVFGPIQL